jgi:hypothetical protein
VTIGLVVLEKINFNLVLLFGVDAGKAKKPA